ncbi:uncharacterized protein C8orf74 homolog isoform X2 [Etheostoma spectabile]|uniref:uncharacterized protein C8orf74 homolog isoform X2 n=1 Tax=Etheostoma spectabile TaxID=54343 RepID=UPI0013AFAAB9|nr:uncharacterized protein C8orf74 homolog isoform X2 [Etheostoma spectabile]
MRQKPKNEASCENLESILFRQLQRVIRACDVIAPHSTARPAHLPASVSIGNQCNFVSSRMDSKHSLTEREMAQIARHQREAGVQRLSCHFSWPEFCDERRCFHQEFVYDVAMFAATCGFSWFNVIRAAVIAKDIFPQLDAGLDVPKLLSLLRDALSECLSNLTPVHRCEFTQFLTDTCITRRRLLQAAVGGAANMTITQLHLEVQLPPTPCPLEQGTDLHEWEHQRQQAELTSRLRQMEERLRSLREGSRVTLEDVDVPDDSQLDEAGVLALVRAAVKATEGQMLASLNQEASLLSDILQLKLQRAALATRRLHNPAYLQTHPERQSCTQPKQD